MRALLMAVALLLGCGEGSPNDCACTANVGDEVLHLACGETGCLAGSRLGCTEVSVEFLGRCGGDLSSPGIADGGACLLPQASCTGATLPCCEQPVDGGVLQPSCDPTSQRCCVPDGQACAESGDCCAGATCSAADGAPRCVR